MSRKLVALSWLRNPRVEALSLVLVPVAAGLGGCDYVLPIVGGAIPHPRPPRGANAIAYGYAANDPINRVDPTGLDTCGRPESALDLLGGLVDCVSNPTDWLDRNTETVEQVVEGLSPNVVGTQFCLVFWFGLMRQDRKTYLTYGSVGFGVNTYAGHAWRCADERSDEGLFGSIGLGPLSVGGSHGVYDPRTHPGGQDHGDNEIDIGFGFGFTIGIFGTKRLEL